MKEGRNVLRHQGQANKSRFVINNSAKTVNGLWLDQGEDASCLERGGLVGQRARVRPDLCIYVLLGLSFQHEWLGLGLGLGLGFVTWASCQRYTPWKVQCCGNRNCVQGRVHPEWRLDSAHPSMQCP